MVNSGFKVILILWPFVLDEPSICHIALFFRILKWEKEMFYKEEKGLREENQALNSAKVLKLLVSFDRE